MTTKTTCTRSCFIEFVSLEEALYGIRWLAEDEALVPFNIFGMRNDDGDDLTIRRDLHTEVYFGLILSDFAEREAGEAGEAAFIAAATQLRGTHTGS